MSVWDKIGDAIFGRREPLEPPAATPRSRERWVPAGPPPLVGERIRVVLGDPASELVRGYLMDKSHGQWIIAEPDVSWKKPGEVFFGSYRPDQIERLDDGSASVADEILQETDDGLVRGDAVLATNERGETHRCTFIAEFRGWRMFRYPVGSLHALPKAQVEPFQLPITAERILALREETGLGMMELKRVLEGRNMRQRLRLAEDFDDLRPILKTLIDDRFPDNERVPALKR